MKTLIKIILFITACSTLWAEAVEEVVVPSNIGAAGLRLQLIVSKLRDGPQGGVYAVLLSAPAPISAENIRTELWHGEQYVGAFIPPLATVSTTPVAIVDLAIYPSIYYFELAEGAMVRSRIFISQPKGSFVFRLADWISKGQAEGARSGQLTNPPPSPPAPR